LCGGGGGGGNGWPGVLDDIFRGRGGGGGGGTGFSSIIEIIFGGGGGGGGSSFFWEKPVVGIKTVITSMDRQEINFLIKKILIEMLTS